MDPARLNRPLPYPNVPSEAEDAAGSPPEYAWRPRLKFQDRRWLNLLLFLATVASTTAIGVGHYLSFQSDFLGPHGPIDITPGLIASGFWFSATIMLILGCHELGHYLACRYYDVDASLPFFMPAPFVMTGTLGAFIRIREPIQTKRQLFDIGFAGPVGGMLIAVPALIFGLSMSRVAPLPVDFVGFELGEPLLFKVMSQLLWGAIPDGYSLNLHPVAFAAWVGLLVTALNLFPVGQLDGGHISYAALGHRSSYVTLAMVGLAILLTYFSTSWVIWTLLMVAMLVKFGRHHPPTYDEEEPLDRSRMLLALGALVMFILCFTPAPIEPLELLR